MPQRFRLPRMVGRRSTPRSATRRSSFETLESRVVLASDSTVVFNEIMYNPAGSDETLEYVELFNQLSYDMDVSGWQLAAGIDFTFPAGTVIRRGQYLVIAQDPDALQDATGIAGVLGPFVGSLANDGEEVELRNNSDRLMDVVDYKDSGAWTVGADGSGASLSKINEDGNGESATAWQASIQIGGSPGAANFAGSSSSTLLTHPLITATSPAKAFVPTNGSLGLTWTGGIEPFNDSGWTAGDLGVGFDVNPDFDPLIGLDLQTAMHNQNGSAYVRIPFQVDDAAAFESLSLGLKYDDGVVVFLNGQEILRRNTFEPASVRASYRLGEDDAGAATGVAGNATTTSTGASANLTRVGNPTYSSNTRSAASSLAMDFEDDDGADVYWTNQIPLAANTTDNFFVEAWVRPEQLDAFDFVASIGRSNNGGIGLLQESGTWKIIHNGVQISASGPAAVLNQWTHLAFVRDNGTSRLYVNGVPSVTLASVPSTPTDRFVIGGNTVSAGFEGQFDGLIDDVRVQTFQPGTFNISMTLAGDPPATPVGGVEWNSVARSDRPDAQAIVAETVNLNGSLGLLKAGTNILAIQGLNASAANDDCLIAPTLTATSRRNVPQLAFNEVAVGGSGDFFIELRNDATSSVALGGLVLLGSGSATHSYTFPAQTLAPGGLIAVTSAQLGFVPVDGDRLFLESADHTELYAGQLVDIDLRGRSASHGSRWLFPTMPTPGTEKVFNFESDIVINEIMFHAAPTLASTGMPAQYATTTVLDWNANWRFNQAGQGAGAVGLLPTDWATQPHSVPETTGWARGPGILGQETTAATLAGFPIPFDANQPLVTVGSTKTTFYFETEFTIPAGTPAGFDLQIQHLIDDGAIFYLNGVEIIDRFNMPSAGVTNTTLASVANEAAVSTPVTISAAALAAAGFQTGVPQRLSVEVHQGGSTGSTDVVFGLKLTLRTETAPAIPGTPFQENPIEWLELYNKSATRTILLDGWELEEAINYTFPPNTQLSPGQYLVIASDPAAVHAAYGISGVLGPYSGTLGNGGERIELNDARRNPADDVRYSDGGQWDSFADGLGASLELLDPRADNAQGEAWAASNEAAKPENEWQTISYRGTVESPLNTLSGGIDRFHEFIFGLFGAGELLIDDVQVRRDPTGANVNVLQNGGFESGTTAWRLQGTHRQSQVIVDPDNASNHVLRLVATGPQEYYHNHIETTFAAGNTIAPGQVYEISYRVKWLRGSNQLNTRLYFDHLAQTTNIEVPSHGGTPGAVNSVRRTNIGPTYQNLVHGPVIPAPGQAVTVSVEANDPDGIASMTLQWAVDGGVFAPVAMTHQGGGRYTAQIPGQAAATVVQFYVSGVDALGANTTFPNRGGTALPIAGADSRALYIVNDGLSASDGRNNFRLIMKQSDLNALFVTSNLMSNDRVGATVIFNETEVYYNVGVRLKGSTRGRATDFGDGHGFNLQFPPDQLFRGAHETISVDRSNRSPSAPNGVDEILAMHIINHAGEIPGMVNDIINLNVAKRPQDNGSAILMMTRYDDTFLDGQYENGSDGTLFEWDTIFVADLAALPTPESPKPAFPSSSFQTELNDKGDSKERYRAPFLIKNNRRQDDFDPIIAMNKALGISGSSTNGGALDLATQAAIDVDQWMRTFALYRLIGIDDTYTSNNNHNLAFYTRPSDGKVLAFPQDLDWVFSPTNVPPTAPLQRGGTNLDRLINIPNNRHHYLGHMHDIVTTTFNPTYMNAWLQHYSDVVPEQDFTGSAFAGYIAARRTSVLSQLPAQVAFEITTPGGTVATPTVHLQGTGWINVREIRLAGEPVALPVVWSSETAWQATVPLSNGQNNLTLEAYDFQGNLIGSDTVTVTSTSVRPIVDQLRIVELMYNSPGNGDAEEFIELMNVSATPIASLAGVSFADGIEFTFGDIALAPGERIVIVRDLAGFQAAYGTQIAVAGTYTGSALENNGEQLILVDADGALIQDFTYDDSGEGWHPATDGDGYSLVIVDGNGPTANWSIGAAWRPSHELGGSPAARDLILGDFDGNDRVDLTDLVYLQSRLGTTSGATRMTGDLNGDGTVSASDVAAFVTRFGRSVAPSVLGGSPAAPDAVVAAAVPDRERRDGDRRQADDPTRLLASRRPVAPRQPLSATVQTATFNGAESTLPAARLTGTRTSAWRLTANSIDTAILAVVAAQDDLGPRGRAMRR